jgi:hypothetical protein
MPSYSAKSLAIYVLDYSSWYLEALNKEWKYYLHHHACQGGMEAFGRSVDDQLLRKISVRCRPEVRAAAELLPYTRKAPYMCKWRDVIKINHFCKFKMHAYAQKMCRELVVGVISDITGKPAAWLEAL